MTFERAGRDMRDYREVGDVAGNFGPARDPALRIGIENHDTMSLPCQLRRQDQRRRRLARAALCIGESDDRHDIPHSVHVRAETDGHGRWFAS
ncbi:hypothetical protein D9M72_581450 [compost metagenome]